MRKCLGAVYLLAAIQCFAAGPVIPVSVTASSTGFVSVALVDTNGVLVRNLVYAQPVAAGTQTFYWDGTTDLGWPAPPGRYTTRAAFFTNGPAVRYVMKVGTSGNPPWRLHNGTGDWGGDLGGPSTITANSTSLVVAWSAVENHRFLTGLQHIDTNGNVSRSYMTFHPYDGRMAGAMDNSQLFLGILNRWQRRIEIARYELGTTNKTILITLPTPEHFTLSGRWKGRWQTVLDGMALTADRIFASVALDDRLFILNRVNGAILQQITVPSPRGLAVRGNRLLVVSSNRVLKVTFDGAIESTLITGAPLDDPYAIAVDASGNIYVSDGGSRRNDPEAQTGNRQVHVFSAAGAHLRSLGAPGGSPRSGAFNRHGFGDVRSLCIGPDGKLWVNEEITGFKRTSRWTTNGVLEREWFGRKLTHYTDLLNPARSNELVYVGRGFDDAPWLTAFSVDWASGTWSPAWSYAQKQEEMYQEDVYLSNDHSHPLQQYQPGKRYPVFQYNPNELVTYGGRHYFLNSAGNGDGAVFTYSSTNKPKPVALVGYHRVEVITNRIVSYYDQGPNQWFTWADANGDGRMAIGESTFTSDSEKLALSSRIFEATLETNLSIRMLRSIGGGVFLESRLPLKQLLPNGAPVYDWAMLEDLTLHQMPSYEGGDGWKHIDRVNYEWMPLHTSDAIYALLDPTTDETLNLPSHDNFWGDRNWRKRVVKFDRATGKHLWSVGRRAPERAVNGEMYNPFGVSVSHGTVFAADVLSMVWCWSQDGLYLGRLFHDAEPGRTWDEYAVHVEVQGPVTLFTNAATGKLYLVVNDTGALVYEVKLPTLNALPPQTIDFTEAMSAAAYPWDPDDRPPLAGSGLHARISGNSILLSWLTNAGGLGLQSASEATGAWAVVTAPRTTNGATIQVTVPRNGARRFFRLR